MLDLIWLIPALPLAGFILILLFGRLLGEPKSGILAASMVGASFAVTVAVFLNCFQRQQKNGIMLSRHSRGCRLGH